MFVIPFKLTSFTVFLLFTCKLYIASLYRHQIYSILSDIFFKRTGEDVRKWSLGTTWEVSVYFYLFSNEECKINLYTKEKSFRYKIICEARGNEYAYPYFTWMPLFNKYLLSSKLDARDFPRLWEYICKHIGESDNSFLIRNFRSSKKE